MDNRSFIAGLAKACNIDSRQSSSLAQSLVDIIGRELSESNDVAVPGFGAFESLKTAEHVETDAAGGARMLMPPKISVVFKPGSRLKKAIANNE